MDPKDFKAIHIETSEWGVKLVRPDPNHYFPPEHRGKPDNNWLTREQARGLAFQLLAKAEEIPRN